MTAVPEQGFDSEAGYVAAIDAVLAVTQQAVLRFHAQHARGKCLIDDAEAIQPWHRRFEELWEAAASCLAATKLGL